jgi:hypothetical protein
MIPKPSQKKKKKLPTIAKVKKRLQEKIVNPYIRQRDSKDGYFKCISCGQTKPVAQMNSGHYIPISKSQFLRFNELNINGECSSCNCWDGYHLIPYRKNLIAKIGLESVEALERTAEEVKLYKHTREELERIETYYTQLLKGKR